LKEKPNEQTFYIHSAYRRGGSFPDGCSGSQEGSEHEHVFDDFEQHFGNEGSQEEVQEERH
jgi:hypothetical protein